MGTTTVMRRRTRTMTGSRCRHVSSPGMFFFTSFFVTNNTTKLWVQVQNGNNKMNTGDEEEVEDDDRLETCVSSPSMFFFASFFVTNFLFLFILGMNCMTTGMPDNGGTWHWQGREGRCDERSLAMEHSVIGFFEIYIHLYHTRVA